MPSLVLVPWDDVAQFFPLVPSLVLVSGVHAAQSSLAAQQVRLAKGSDSSPTQGLGKTVQLISFLGVIRTLFQDIGPHIVVCPVSLLENWEREIKWWCPSLEVRWVLPHKSTGFMRLRC